MSFGLIDDDLQREGTDNDDLAGGLDDDIAFGSPVGRADGSGAQGPLKRRGPLVASKASAAPAVSTVTPCFTPGALIATPRGEMPVETLRVGDRIVTRDNGIQEIRWIGSRSLTGAELRLNSHLQPILIKRHSLGNGLPEQDMMVSPNHRMLVANDRTQLYFDEREVLVAAKHMAGTKGVHSVESIGTTYIHFMFDRHEVVLANGTWTESFQPGDYSLKGIGNSQRNELLELFPDLKDSKGLENYGAARRTLTRQEARVLIK